MSEDDEDRRDLRLYKIKVKPWKPYDYTRDLLDDVVTARVERMREELRDRYGYTVDELDDTKQATFDHFKRKEKDDVDEEKPEPFARVMSVGTDRYDNVVSLVTNVGSELKRRISEITEVREFMDEPHDVESLKDLPDEIPVKKRDDEDDKGCIDPDEFLSEMIGEEVTFEGLFGRREKGEIVDYDIENKYVTISRRIDDIEVENIYHIKDIFPAEYNDMCIDDDGDGE